MSHSILPPSGAGVWGKTGGCTGSIMMSQMCPDISDDQDALEGEATHEIGETIIEAARTNTHRFELSDFEGKTAKNGIVWTDEMYQSAVHYAGDVINTMRSTGVFNHHLRVEQRVDLSMVHPEQFGTPDVDLYAPHLNTLHIKDFKHGHGKVEAFENWQMLNYTPGIMAAHGIDGHKAQQTKIVYTVIQPRAFHRDGIVRTWEVMASDVRAYVNIIEANAVKALGPDAELQTGDHCRYCPARYACPAATEAGVGLFEVATKPVPLEMTHQQMGLQLAIVTRARKQLEYLETGLKEQIESIMRGGKDVPHWYLEQNYGNEKWTVPADEVVAMGDIVGQQLRKPVAAITPNQARAQGVDPTVVEMYSEKPKTGFKLTPDNLNKAKKVFSNG